MTHARIAFLFPGQASQYVGMGRDLYDRYPLVRTLYQQAHEITGSDIAGISFTGPAEKLKQTKYTQLAILVHSVAIASLLNEQEIKPEYLAGHSLGEYSGLVAAGSLSFEETVRLVSLRGDLMNEAGKRRPGTMAAIIGLPQSTIDEICHESTTKDESVQMANFNSPLQTVIAGAVPAVERAITAARTAGAKRALRLAVSGAFHSELMEYARKGLADAIGKAPISRAKIPVIANVTGQPVVEVDDIRSLLIEQLTRPVRWAESMERLVVEGVDTIVEVGPGNVLSGLMRRTHRGVSVFNTDTIDNVSGLGEALGANNVEK